MRALGFELKREDYKKLRAPDDEEEDDTKGVIYFNKFLQLATEKIAELDPREEMEKAFAMFDSDKTGSISYENLRRIARELGESMSDEEIKEIVEGDTKDSIKEIGQEEFFTIMQKTNLF